MDLDVTTVLCDLDGVVWLAHEPIPGSVAAIATLRESGRRVLFVTNNSASRISDQEAALAAIGIDAAGDVVSSAMAAASLVQPGERVLVTGGPGVTEAVTLRGALPIANTGADSDLGDPIDAVIVGLHRDFDYHRLRIAARAVRHGARLIGTNADATYPTPRGLEPGGGTILAAVAAASGVDPVVAGKPEQPMATLIHDMLSTPDEPFGARAAIMVGDRPETDGLFAARIGCRFALVDSGVTRPGAVIDDVVPVTGRFPDLDACTRSLTTDSGQPARAPSRARDGTRSC